MSLCQPVIWIMATMLRDSVVVVVVRTRPRATTINMRKSNHWFPFVSHIWDAYGAPLGFGPPELRYNTHKSRKWTKIEVKVFFPTRMIRFLINSSKYFFRPRNNLRFKRPNFGDVLSVI